MNDKQKNIIDKLNKDNESLNQGHKSMVEYSKGMICIGLFVVCFLIPSATRAGGSAPNASSPDPKGACRRPRSRGPFP